MTSDGESDFIDRVRALEEHLLADQLDPKESSRIRKDRPYYWDFRPSHHVRKGLVTQSDVDLLRQPGKRLLSVGAYPGYLERMLVELGVPAEHLLLSDNDAAAWQTDLPTVAFDLTQAWPDIGTFDLILFPESLCIAIGDRIKTENLTPSDTPHATDAREAELLAFVLQEALKRLRPGGVIRANGPMSHPNVVRQATELLQAKGFQPQIGYSRYLLTVRDSLT